MSSADKPNLHFGVVLKSTIDPTEHRNEASPSSGDQKKQELSPAHGGVSISQQKHTTSSNTSTHSTSRYRPLDFAEVKARFIGPDSNYEYKTPEQKLTSCNYGVMSDKSGSVLNRSTESQPQNSDDDIRQMLGSLPRISIDDILKMPDNARHYCDSKETITHGQNTSTLSKQTSSTQSVVTRTSGTVTKTLSGTVTKAPGSGIVTGTSGPLIGTCEMGTKGVTATLTSQSLTKTSTSTNTVGKRPITCTGGRILTSSTVLKTSTHTTTTSTLSKVMSRSSNDTGMHNVPSLPVTGISLSGKSDQASAIRLQKQCSKMTVSERSTEATSEKFIKSSKISSSGLSGQHDVNSNINSSDPSAVNMARTYILPFKLRPVGKIELLGSKLGTKMNDKNSDSQFVLSEDHQKTDSNEWVDNLIQKSQPLKDEPRVTSQPSDLFEKGYSGKNMSQKWRSVRFRMQADQVTDSDKKLHVDVPLTTANNNEQDKMLDFSPGSVEDYQDAISVGAGPALASLASLAQPVNAHVKGGTQQSKNSIHHGTDITPSTCISSSFSSCSAPSSPEVYQDVGLTSYTFYGEEGSPFPADQKSSLEHVKGTSHEVEGMSVSSQLSSEKPKKTHPLRHRRSYRRSQLHDIEPFTSQAKHQSKHVTVTESPSGSESDDDKHDGCSTDSESKTETMGETDSTKNSLVVETRLDEQLANSTSQSSLNSQSVQLPIKKIKLAKTRKNFRKTSNLDLNSKTKPQSASAASPVSFFQKIQGKFKILKKYKSSEMNINTETGLYIEDDDIYEEIRPHVTTEHNGGTGTQTMTMKSTSLYQNNDNPPVIPQKIHRSKSDITGGKLKPDPTPAALPAKSRHSEQYHQRPSSGYEQPITQLVMSLNLEPPPLPPRNIANSDSKTLSEGCLISSDIYEDQIPPQVPERNSIARRSVDSLLRVRINSQSNWPYFPAPKVPPPRPPKTSVPMIDDVLLDAVDDGDSPPLPPPRSSRLVPSVSSSPYSSQACSINQLTFGSKIWWFFKTGKRTRPMEPASFLSKSGLSEFEVAVNIQNQDSLLLNQVPPALTSDTEKDFVDVHVSRTSFVTEHSVEEEGYLQMDGASSEAIQSFYGFSMRVNQQELEENYLLIKRSRYKSRFEREPLYQYYNEDLFLRSSKALDAPLSRIDSAGSDFESSTAEGGGGGGGEYIELPPHEDDEIYIQEERVLPPATDVQLESPESSEKGTLSKLSDTLRKGATLQRTMWSEMAEVQESGVLQSMSLEERRQQEAMFEVITSEASYFKSLNVLIENFVMLPEFSQDNHNSVLSAQDRHFLFSNIGDVRDASERLLSALETRWQQNVVISDISDVIIQNAVTNFDPYVRYCTNQKYQERTNAVLMRTNTVFVEKVQNLQQNPDCQSLPLMSFLLLPMQRICRLPLLMDAVCKHLEPDSTKQDLAFRAINALNKVVKRCNDGARRMDQTEQMLRIDKMLNFKIKKIPIISSMRHLFKEGELTRIATDSSKLFTRRPSKQLLYFFLFNDLLIITKKKSESNYVVLDYTARNSIHVEELSESRQKELLPNGIPTGCRFLFFLVILDNHEGRVSEMILSCESLNELERWLAAVTPSEQVSDEGKIYEEWDCPQVEAIMSYTALQPDELTLVQTDVINVFQKIKDVEQGLRIFPHCEERNKVVKGWYRGERIRDSERGWFPESCVKEVASSHVRARNLRQQYRLLHASYTKQGQQKLTNAKSKDAIDTEV